MLKKTIAAAAVLLLGSNAAWSADMFNGQMLNKSCALCHGAYGQGASGKLSPRIAGLPKEYIIKAMKDYVDGTRVYPLMVRTSQIDKYSERDYEDVAAYLASIDLSPDPMFDIRAPFGNADEGQKIFRKECRTCHGSDGYGRPSKEAPPLAGQHPEYLYTTMRNFNTKFRIHANDKEDETFNELTEEDFVNLTAYLATLDDARVIAGFQFQPPIYRPSLARPARSEVADSIQITEIAQTVVRMAAEQGVTPEQAEEAMLAKAEEIGLMKVGQQKVSQFLARQDVQMPHLSIHQFCNPLDARVMVMADPILSSYMPCRISMVEDENGKLWLMMLNLDMLINSKLMPGDVVETAIKVNQQMLEVMTAGATGKP